MLTANEKQYLLKIPEDRTVSIRPFDLKLKRLAEKLISEIHELHPELLILHMGASGLGISGQDDLDLYILSNPKLFTKFLPFLIEKYGQPESQNPDSIAWKFERDAVPIEMYLTNPESESMHRQIMVFQKLFGNPKLLQEYEQLKSSMNGLNFRDYQQKKYEFYHRILGE